MTQALQGLGAKKYGGRWNSKGVAVVYTSESLEPAVLEAQMSRVIWAIVVSLPYRKLVLRSGNHARPRVAAVPHPAKLMVVPRDGSVP
jgi:hypothetical protein